MDFDVIRLKWFFLFDCNVITWRKDGNVVVALQGRDRLLQITNKWPVAVYKQRHENTFSDEKVISIK